MRFIFLIFASFLFFSPICHSEFLKDNDYRQPLIGGGVHDYLHTLDRKGLEEHALALEKYHDSFISEQKFGGLHDYIERLSDDEITSYILKEVNEHPEVNNMHKLKELTTKKFKSTLIGGGIHDYLFTLDRKGLEEHALALEKYHDKATGRHKLGGLHDYIQRLSDEEVASYILKEVNEHPELNNMHKLKELTTYNKIEERHPLIGGGVHDYLRTLDRNSLEEHALALEKYHDKTTGRHKLGGLHDFIKRLSDEEVASYILKEVSEHPELNNMHKLKELTMGNTPSQALEFLEDERKPIFIGGGIHDYLYTLDRKALETHAIALEKYHDKVLGRRRLGGLHDYIDRLTDEEIRKHILDEVNEHPEMNDMHALKKLATSF